jgi:pyruvate kinase
MPRTKIVCTLGPASESEDVLREMIRAGMDVARLNFSHGDHPAHARRLALVRRLAQEEGKEVAVIQDLQGPRLRAGAIAAGSTMLREGERFTLTTRQVPGDEREVTAPYSHLPQDVRPGDRLLLDDGLLELKVEEVTDTDVVCRVVVGGVLRERKGVSLPGVTLSLPSLTEKDHNDLAFGLAQGVDYVALSFVRRASDIEELRALMAARGLLVPIIAKIEKGEAIDDFDDILAVSDGVMVARGDLGVEMPAEEVPLYQKMIIRKANAVGKPVVTATQMLQSMMDNPRPTRAEASDVANAILDGTDAVMLSGETAVGKYPLEAVRTMARIAVTTEQNFPYEEWLRMAFTEAVTSVTEAISLATCEIACELGAQAIIASTSSGATARAVARHRPTTPIIAITPNEAVQRRLALVWGVHPLLVPRFASTDEMITTAMKACQEAGLVKTGDRLVITAGVPMFVPGRTNMLQVRVVGEG